MDAEAIAAYIGAAVSTAGVLVALWIALHGDRQRHKERLASELAEARMFRVRGTGGKDKNQVAGDPVHVFHWYVEHAGPHPVFDIHYEAWPGGTRLEDRAKLLAHREIGMPGDNLDTRANVSLEDGAFRLSAWRVRWTDRYGNQWAFGERQRLERQGPIAYRSGDLPPPY